MAVEEVLRVVSALYSETGEHGDVSKDQASRILHDFQQTTNAWQVALEILNKRPSPEACYFAAQTLKLKIQTDYRQLPADFLHSLRDKLMQLVLLPPGTLQAPALRQLCIAVADLALLDERWSHSLVFLMQQLNTPDFSHTRATTLLQIMQYIPEDLWNKKLYLGENRRNIVRQELLHDSPQCVAFLAHILSDKHMCTLDVEVKLFKVLSSWLAADILQASSLEHCDFFVTAFVRLHDPDCDSDLHDAASDFLCSALYSCQTKQQPAAAAAAGGSEGLGGRLFDGIVGLRDAYMQTVAAEDTDKGANLARLFAEAAETFIDVVRTLPASGLGNKVILDILLDCCGHYEMEIPMSTFNFWFNLCDSLGATEHERGSFRPYFERLILSLYRLNQLDPDRTTLLDRKEDVYELRMQSRDLIIDSVVVVSPVALFSHMNSVLEDQASSWVAVEAAVFVLAAVAKYVPRDEEDVTPRALQNVLALAEAAGPRAPPQAGQLCLHETALDLLGHLADWVAAHPAFLGSVLPFLAHRLQNEEELKGSAATALMNVCSANADALVPHFASLCELLQLLDQVHSSSSSQPAASVHFIQALATILSQQDAAGVRQGLLHLSAHVLAPLKRGGGGGGGTDQCDQPKAEAARVSGTVMPALDRLAVLLANTRVPTVEEGEEHPMAPAVAEILPIVASLLDRYKSSERVTEKCCRVLRYAVRGLGPHFETFLSALVEQVVALFNHNGFSCFLYLGGIIVDEFGASPAYSDGISALLTHYSGKVLQQLSEDDGFRNHPDTVDDFFRLAIRVTQKCPQVLFASDTFLPILDAAVRGLHVHHKEALVSVCEFLDTLFSTAAREQHLRAEVSRRVVAGGFGDQLMTQALFAVLFSLPRHLINHISVVYQALSQFDPDAFQLFLAHAFQALSVREETAKNKVSEQQMRACYDQLTASPGHREVAKTLKQFVKFYR